MCCQWLASTGTHRTCTIVPQAPAQPGAAASMPPTSLRLPPSPGMPWGAGGWALQDTGPARPDLRAVLAAATARRQGPPRFDVRIVDRSIITAHPHSDWQASKRQRHVGSRGTGQATRRGSQATSTGLPSRRVEMPIDLGRVQASPGRAGGVLSSPPGSAAPEGLLAGSDQPAALRWNARGARHPPSTRRGRRRRRRRQAAEALAARAHRLPAALVREVHATPLTVLF